MTQININNNTTSNSLKYNGAYTSVTCGTSGYTTADNIIINKAALRLVWEEECKGSLYKGYNPPIKNMSKTFFEKLEDEINNWHGSLLTELKEKIDIIHS